MSYIDIYRVKVQVTLDVPDGFTGNFVQELVEIPLELRVQGCAITSFTASPADLGTFTYTVGDATTTLGPYTLIQDDDCGYVPTQVLLVQAPSDTLPDPSWFTFNSNSNDFLITKTEELDYVGTYNLKVEATIQVPDGFDGNFLPRVVEIPFVMEVLNPCESTVLEAFTIPDMETSVLAANPAIEIVTELVPQDSVSQALGD